MNVVAVGRDADEAFGVLLVNKGGQTEVRLVVRVGRNVDSLDIDLFLEALAMRRQFLASRG